MKILHLYPINSLSEKPTSWRNSQIESLSDTCDNYHFSVINRVNPLNLFFEGMRLKKYIKKNNIQLVHCHWGTSLSLIAVLFSNKPTIISYCGSDLLGSYNSKGKIKFKGRLSILLSRLSSLLSSYNIVKSQQLYDNLPRIGKQKCSIIPNGVNSRDFYPKSKEKSRQNLKLPLNKIIILFINSGAWVKNPEMAHSINNKLNNISKDFYFLEISKIPHDLMIDYYSASDFLLITSRHEGSSNAIKEALYCNLKVISTPVGDAIERLKYLPYCLISDNESEIVNFIVKNKDIDYSTPLEVKKPIDIITISEQIINIYAKFL